MEQLTSENSELRIQLELARQQQQRVEDNKLLLQTQLNEMIKRCESLHDEKEDRENEVGKLTARCDSLRSENRKITNQLEKVTQENVTLGKTWENVRLKKEENKNLVTSPTMELITSEPDAVMNSVSETESIQEETYESAEAAWDTQSVGSVTPSVFSQARELARSHLRINTNQASSSKKAKSKSKFQTPYFYGDNKPTPQQWLIQFKKLIIYHGYNEEECKDEFMMAMQGYAGEWWDSLSSEIKNNFELLITAFEQFYGGSKASMARSIVALKTLAQNKESMSTFGPRLQNLITTVDKSNVELQLSYFYAAVDSQVADAVLATRPTTLAEAVHVAIELEQGKMYKTGYTATTRGVASTPAKIDWAPMAAKPSEAEPMEIDVNAQSRYRSKEGNKGGKCYVCERTNHVMKDCWLLEEAKNMAKSKHSKNKKGKSNFQKKKYPAKATNSQNAVALDCHGNS